VLAVMAPVASLLTVIVLVLIGAVIYILAFALIPKLVRAQFNGRAAGLALGHAPNGIPMDAGEGLRQVALEGGEIGTGVIEAMLIDEGLDVRLHRDSGGALGGLAAVYFLLYREKDEDRVLEAIARQQA
jgi:hypothetical protein